MNSWTRIALIFSLFSFSQMGVALALPVDHGKKCFREGQEGTVNCNLESTNWCHCCINGTCYSHGWTLAKSAPAPQRWTGILSTVPEFATRRDVITKESSNVGMVDIVPDADPEPACDPQSQYDYCRKVDGGRKMECRGRVTQMTFDRRDFERSSQYATPVRPDGSYACTAILQAVNPNNPTDGDLRSVPVRLSGKSDWHRDFCHLLKDAYLSNGAVALVYDIAGSNPSCSSDAEPHIFLIGFPDIN